MTVPRLHELARLVEATTRDDAHLAGSVMSVAMHDPKRLSRLARQRRQPSELPTSGPLAIPKRRRPG